MREELRRRALGQVMLRLEQLVAAMPAEGQQRDDLVVSQGGRLRFRPDVLEHLHQQRSGADYRTLGGETMTVAMLTEVDPSFDFDRVARRVARTKLLSLMVAVTAFSNPDNESAARSSAGVPPEEWLSRLVQLGAVQPTALLDPWGRPFVAAPRGDTPAAGGAERPGGGLGAGLRRRRRTRGQRRRRGEPVRARGAARHHLCGGVGRGRPHATPGAAGPGAGHAAAHVHGLLDHVAGGARRGAGRDHRRDLLRGLLRRRDGGGRAGRRDERLGRTPGHRRRGGRQWRGLRSRHGHGGPLTRGAQRTPGGSCHGRPGGSAYAAGSGGVHAGLHGGAHP
jgi:hypothetical protein